MGLSGEDLFDYIDELQKFRTRASSGNSVIYNCSNPGLCGRNFLFSLPVSLQPSTPPAVAASSCAGRTLRPPTARVPHSPTATRSCARLPSVAQPAFPGRWQTTLRLSAQSTTVWAPTPGCRTVTRRGTDALAAAREDAVTRRGCFMGFPYGSRTGPVHSPTPSPSGVRPPLKPPRPRIPPEMSGHNCRTSITAETNRSGRSVKYATKFSDGDI